LLLCALFIGANSHNHEFLGSFNAPQVQQPVFQQQQPVFQQRQQPVFQPQQRQQQQIFQAQASNQRFQSQKPQQFPFINQPQVSMNSQRNFIQPPKFQPNQKSSQQPQSILSPRPENRAAIIAQIERQLQKKSKQYLKTFK
jgi:hypothetical protein